MNNYIFCRLRLDIAAFIKRHKTDQ